MEGTVLQTEGRTQETQWGMENQNIQHNKTRYKDMEIKYNKPQDKTRHKNTTQRTQIRSHDTWQLSKLLR